MVRGRYFWSGLLVLGLGTLALALFRTSAADVSQATHRVTLMVRGRSEGEARLITLRPLVFGAQAIWREEATGTGLAPQRVVFRDGDLRQIQWTVEPGFAGRPIEARYSFLCTTNANDSAARRRQRDFLYRPPTDRERDEAVPGIDADIPAMAEEAARACSEATTAEETAAALLRFVRSQEGGSAPDPARRLVALCRNRGLAARLVHGLNLQEENEVHPLVWVEAWTGNRWTTLCPTSGHCGEAPPNYLVFGFGDLVLVRGASLSDLAVTYHVEALGR